MTLNTLIMFIILCIGAIIVIAFMYVKIKYRFWTLQPMYHNYNIFYILGKKMRIIKDTLSTMNRYVNIIDISTMEVEKISESDRQKIANFIKDNSLQYKNLSYFPKDTDIFPYIESFNTPGYVSVYQRPRYLLSKATVISDKEYVALLSATPLHITFYKRDSLPLYLLDNIAVALEYANKDTISKLVQTHIYNVALKNQKIKVYLLKKFKKPPIVKTLTTFNMLCYNIAKIPKQDNIIVNYRIVELGESQIVLINDFIKNNKDLYSCVVIGEISNIIHLIKTGNISFMGVLVQTKLIGLYVFKKHSLMYSKQKTFYNGCSLVDKEYRSFAFEYFCQAVRMYSTKYKTQYIWLETIGLMKTIADNLTKLQLPIVKKKGYYILYNYISPPIHSTKCMFLI